MATNDQLDAFLKRMAKIESSNDYNAIHQPVNYGVHGGDRAVGKYGLMPTTVATILKDMQRTVPGFDPLDASQHLPLPLLQNPPKHLEHLSAQHLARQVAEDPESQDVVARHFAKMLLDKPGIDDERAAAMWQFGQNLDQKPNALGTDGRLGANRMNDTEHGMGQRIEKYRALVQKENPGVPQLVEESRVIVPQEKIERDFPPTQRNLASEEAKVSPLLHEARQLALQSMRDKNKDEDNTKPQLP